MGRKRDKEYFYKEIYLRYAPALMRFAEKFVSRVHVEDIVHDVFLKLWDKDIVLPENELKNILYASVRNSCIDHLRRKDVRQKYTDRRTTELKLEELHRFENPDDFFRDDYALKKIMDKISGLPPRRQQIFRLAYFGEMKASDIASRLDISVRTVENSLYRTLIYLRDDLSR